MMKDINGIELKVGQDVKVYCMAPASGTMVIRPSLKLGKVVEYDNFHGMAVAHAETMIGVEAFKLEVVENDFA